MLLKFDTNDVYRACENLLYAKPIGLDYSRVSRIRDYCANDKVLAVWLSEADYELLKEWF